MSFWDNLPIHLLIAAPVALIFSNSIKLNPIRFQCDNYLLNTYLYFILLFGLFIASLKIIQSYNLKPQDLYVGNRRLFFMILAIVTVFLLTFIPADYFWSKHIVLLGSMLIAGLSTFGIVKEFNNDFEYISNTIIPLLVLLALFSLFNSNILMNSGVNEWTWGLLGFIFGLAHPKLHSYDKKEINPNTPWITAALCGITTFYIPSLASNAAACVNPDYINQIFAFLRPDVQQAI